MSDVDFAENECVVQKTRSTSASIKRPNPRTNKQLTTDIFATLKESQINANKIGANFISLLLHDPDAGIANLLNLLLRSSGYNGGISKTQILVDDPVTVLSEIQSSSPTLFEKEFIFQKKAKREFKTFKTKFFSLVSAIVQEVNKNEDTFAPFKRLLGWVLALSSCQYRPFRISATVFGAAIQDNLCSLIVYNYAGLDKEHVSVSKYNSLLDFIFNGLYLHRYRDVDPFIRSICISHLAQWIITYPKKFLDNSYLRYIGWILSDKIPEARIAAFNAIILLISSDEKEIMFSGMRSFLDRFLPRILECASRDKDVSVQNCALDLLLALSSNSLIDANVLEQFALVLFSNNLDAKATFLRICRSIFVAQPIVGRIPDRYYFLMHLSDWLIKLLGSDPFVDKAPISQILCSNVAEAGVGFDELNEFSVENIVSFLSFDSWDLEVDKIRIVLLYFIQSIFAFSSSKAEISSLVVINWKKIYHNVHSTSIFKSLIFSLFHDILLQCPIAAPSSVSHQEWLISISDIFSDSMRFFIESPDIEIAEGPNPVCRFIFDAFGMDQLVVEKKNVLENVFSFLDERFSNEALSYKEVTIKYFMMVQELQTSSLLLDYYRSRFMDVHLHGAYEKYLQFINILKQNQEKVILDEVECLSFFLLALIKSSPDVRPHAPLIHSLINSSSMFGIVSRDHPSSLSLKIYVDSLLLVIKSGIITTRDINSAPLDCLSLYFKKDPFVNLTNSQNSQSTNYQLSDFISKLQSDFSIGKSTPFTNLKSFLWLLYFNLVDFSIIGEFIQRCHGLSSCVVFLFRSFFTFLFTQNLLEETSSAYFTEISIGCLNSASMEQAIKFVSEVLDSNSVLIVKFITTLVSVVVKRIQDGQSVDFILFKALNEQFSKPLLSASVTSEVTAALDQVIIDRATPNIDHFIQFKKFLTRITCIPKASNDLAFGKGISLDPADMPIGPIVTENSRPKNNEKDHDFLHTEGFIDTGCITTDVFESLEPSMMDNSIVNESEIGVEFPTSPLLE